ncbi:MAG: cytochrome P450 [Candidatus Binatia bacterium]
MGFWAVSRHEDVFSILKNPQMFSSAVFMDSFLGDLNPFPPQAPAIVSCDPPDHTRLRKLVNRAFTPRRIAGLEQHLREVVQQLLEPAVARGDCDVIRDLAIPLPVIAIAELLGVPPERRHDFKRWADNFIRGSNPLALSPQIVVELRQSLEEFYAYFRDAIAACRKKPGDNLISDLVRAEEENQMLTGEEVLSLVILLVIGGAETTTNLVGNAVLALLDHPEQWAKVQASPALVPQAVEEVLRYDAPVQWLFRQTTQEVEMAGAALPAGAAVMFLMGSANRDERKFPDPDRFDILRNCEGHVGFGFGIHFCLGTLLARLEAKLALEELLKRFPRLTCNRDHITWGESIFLRGLTALPLVVE